MTLLGQGKTKAKIQEETGQVVGGQDISFQQQSGELFVIMGLSGSGKSTLLRCINRLVEPTSGHVYLGLDDGNTIEITALGKSKLRNVREHYISMIFQSFALFPHRTVLANTTFSLEIQGVDKSERSDRAMDVLELVGLDSWANAYPSQLSGGMQQRVGLARALVSGAPVVLMDEAFSALDPLIKVHMQDELLKLQEQFQRTLLFVTHDLDEALRLGDRIAIMEAGRFVQVGTPENIIVNPKTEYVERFVQNADPTNVLTAGTIATSVHQLQSVDGGYRLTENSKISVDKEGRPQEALVEGVRKAVLTEDEFEDHEGEGEALLVARGDAPMRDVMRMRLQAIGPLCTTDPVIIIDGDGVFSGVITERNVLHGLLEKGRQEVQPQ